MRVSEVYLSVQGEGPRVGEPTVFVRFGGCNLRCPGWPCDTEHAINPVFREEWEKLIPEELVKKIEVAAGSHVYSTNICFTGGEPMLQSANELNILIGMLVDMGYETFEMFSNGTLDYPPDILDNVHIVMDWKLPGAGEKFSPKQEETRWANLHALSGGDAVKFTVRDESDFMAAQVTWATYLQETRRPPHDQPEFFCGRVWDGYYTDADLVAQMLDERVPWRYNMQIHNHIWDRRKRGI